VRYVLSRDDEDDVLGDVRRMITDPFEVPGDEDEVESAAMVRASASM
jgi:hypothetical protein